MTFLLPHLPAPQYTVLAFRQSRVTFEERRKALQKSSLLKGILDFFTCRYRFFVNKCILFLHSYIMYAVFKEMHSIVKTKETWACYVTLSLVAHYTHFSHAGCLVVASCINGIGAW